MTDPERGLHCVIHGGSVNGAAPLTVQFDARPPTDSGGSFPSPAGTHSVHRRCSNPLQYPRSGRPQALTERGSGVVMLPMAAPAEVHDGAPPYVGLTRSRWRERAVRRDRGSMSGAAPAREGGPPGGAAPGALGQRLAAGSLFVYAAASVRPQLTSEA